MEQLILAVGECDPANDIICRPENVIELFEFGDPLFTIGPLEFTRTVIDNTTLADTQVLSELEDADFAEAAAMLYRHEAALETALIISARMMQNSLLDYLE